MEDRRDELYNNVIDEVASICTHGTHPDSYCIPVSVTPSGWMCKNCERPMKQPRKRDLIMAIRMLWQGRVQNNLED